MTLNLNILIILISSIALVKGVNLFISSISHIAHKMRISGYTISFFLVAVGTSLPEIVVAIASAADGKPILSFGNAIGSNVALVTLVAAIPAIINKRVSTSSIVQSKDIYYTAMFSIMPILLSIDGYLGRIDGLILLLSYGAYIYFVLRKAHGFEAIADIFEQSNTIKQFFIFVLSLVILLGSSSLIVNSAVEISLGFGVGLGIIGLTLTALGTSLPEIAFSIAASKNGQRDEVLGDVVGSVVANSTVVLGLAATIYPMDLTQTKIGMPSIFFLIMALLIFLRVVKTGGNLDRSEGILLIMVYILFITSELWIAVL